MNRVIAVLCADIHLSHNPPLARSAEPDWYAAMKRPLDELGALQDKHDAPILCAGDVFEKYSSPPELINFAIEHMPFMYSVCGQHDLPYNRFDDIKKSSWRTLELAEALREIQTGKLTRVTGACYLAVWGWSWGFDVEPLEESTSSVLDVAVIHSYCWTTDRHYPNAPDEKRVTAYKDRLKGYDVAVFGDNHKGFTAKSGDCTVFNCGRLMNRRMDERNGKPQVGLLHDDGTITSHYLDTSKDKYIDPSRVLETKTETDVGEFMDELRELEVDSTDFRECVLRYLDDHHVEDGVREKVLVALE